MPLKDNLLANHHIRMAEYQNTMTWMMLERPFLYSIFQNNYVFPKQYKIEIVTAPPGENTSENHNGTWTGILGLLQRGEADLITFPMTIDEEKLKVVDFLNVRFYNALVLGSKIKITLSQGDVMDEFTRAEWKIWMLLSVCMVLLIAFVMLLNYDEPKMSHSDMAHLYVSYMLGEGSVSVLSKARNRIVATFFFWFMIILKTCLFAYLKTSLVAIDREKINSLRELIEHKTTRPLILNRGGDILDALRNPDIETYRALMEKTDETGILDLNGGFVIFINRIKKAALEDYAFIGERTTMYSVFDTVVCRAFRELRFHIVNEEIQGTAYGLAIRKFDKDEDRIFHQLVNEMTSLLTEAGFVELIQALLRGGTPSCFGEYADMDITEADSLTLEGFGKAFNTLMFGLALATIAFIVELLVGRSRTTEKKALKP